eukprot:scaffold102186_cov53-Prasinocladus_malaysianus.AAC.1
MGRLTVPTWRYTCLMRRNMATRTWMWARYTTWTSVASARAERRGRPLTLLVMHVDVQKSAVPPCV